MVLMKTTAIRRFPKWSPYGLFMVFPKTSADGYFPYGLHMDFLRSSQRPPPVTKAPRKPDGLHGDHLLALTKTAILFLPAVGLYRGFLGSLQRPFSGAYKDHLPERIPLSRQKEFKRIKNIVIQEAVRLGAQLEQSHSAPVSTNTAAGQRNDEHSSALLFNSVTRLLYHTSRIFQEQQPPASPVYHTDRKLLRKLREKKIAHGHKPDDHAPKLS